MDTESLDGHTIAVLLWIEGESAESEEDVFVFNGVLYRENDVLYVDRGTDNPPFEIVSDWYSLIRELSNRETKAILNGADYMISLNVGQLPADTDPDDITFTGLNISSWDGEESDNSHREDSIE
jgi:hypothetical protein